MIKERYEEMMQNPFTTTFSKIPDHTYIPTDQEDMIIENFGYDAPSESLFKITGVRGSGKTVMLARVEEAFGTEEAAKKAAKKPAKKPAAKTAKGATTKTGKKSSRS